MGSTASPAEELAGTLTKLLQASIAPSSYQLYRRSWTLFKECQSFLLGAQATPASIPLTTNQVCLYISFLHKNGYAPTSIVSFTSAIGYVHRISNVKDPTSSLLVQKLLSATLKLRPTVDPRLPITIIILQRLVSALSTTVSCFSHRRLLRAMFVVAFFGLMRVGEITMSKDGVVPLHVNQVRITPDMVTITISKFKHNKSMRPVDIPLPKQDIQDICPVAALHDYLVYRGDSPGPLFALSNLSPVKREFFIKHLRKTLSYCGFSWNQYKSHSFRIGGASYYADLGFSDAQIRLLGRWGSDAFLQYIRSFRALHS